jgi:hypothetical protein
MQTSLGSRRPLREERLRRARRSAVSVHFRTNRTPLHIGPYAPQARCYTRMWSLATAMWLLAARHAGTCRGYHGRNRDA